MHGLAAMRQETGRLEQRQPGAQPGSDGVRSGSDRCLEPGHGVLGAGQRNEERLAGADRLGLAVRWRLLFVPARERILVLVHGGARFLVRCYP